MTKQPKWKEVSKDIRDLVKDINQDMFIKAVSTVNALSVTELNDFEVNQLLKKQMFDNPRVSVCVTIQ